MTDPTPLFPALEDAVKLLTPEEKAALAADLAPAPEAVPASVPPPEGPRIVYVVHPGDRAHAPSMGVQRL